MASSVLFNDIKLKFPHFAVLKASAGSGKTYALTQRFVQFILSDKIPKNHLRNILAITFSNNAAKEMRERIIKCLKNLYFGDQNSINDFISLVSLSRDEIPQKAGMLIDEILENYSDFHVKTIDSFMTSIFKASAIDFGYNPDFEIVMDNDSFMEYSFNLFLRKAKEGSQEASVLDDAIRIIHEQKSQDSSFLWDPALRLLEEQMKIYTKLASIGKSFELTDYSPIIKEKCDEIKAEIEIIEREIELSGLQKNKNSSFDKILNFVKKDRFADIIDVGLINSPVNKPGNKANKQEEYEKINKLWKQLISLIKDYIMIFSRSYYMPYLKVYSEFNEIIENTKRYQGKIFIGDINHYLASYLESQIVPDIYFRIGETIYHFLIDEFQDTSPIQWHNLSPLISNSLSQEGSLFIVGDTKQAIYGFRDADYRIMKGCETENIFPSAHHTVSELQTNFRSLPEILMFNEKVFKEKAASNSKYSEPAGRSGLSDYIQKPKQGTEDGYVSLSILEKNDDSLPERERLIEIIDEIIKRGYAYSDITILTSKNDDVVMVTKWLNENNISFISMSSLDVRRRKITGEIISLMNFLDSPIDDLSFAAFITGDIFSETLISRGMEDAVLRIHDFLLSTRESYPRYKTFQKEFSSIWEEFFEELFRLTGYLPLYEIVIRIIKTFRLFDLKCDEEAALIKILETIKDFESSGLNSIRDFLEFAAADSSRSEWDITLPSNIDAVKVMTIHKAKGLGFPVVIIFSYEDKNRGFEYIIEKTTDKVRLLKINGHIAKSNSSLQQIYDEERINETVNKLNSLYVGLTRAERELYVIGIKGRSNNYPFDLLPVTDFSQSGKKSNKSAPTQDGIHKGLPLFHHSKIIPILQNKDRLINLEERRRGELIHRVLSFVEYVTDGFEYELSRIIDLVGKEMRIAYSFDEIKELVIRLVNHSLTKDFFTLHPCRIIKNEMEIADNTGRLFRLDRLVSDEKRIIVIDYKTGSDMDAINEHISQVRNYMKLLHDIYQGKRLSGIIAYIDMRDIKIIEVK